jgi:hypothetical protein
VKLDFNWALLLLKHIFMKLDSTTQPFDLATAATGGRRNWLSITAFSLVVAGACLLQGCLAGAWVALVSVDSMKSSNVTFEPFEQSWVAQKDLSSDAVKRLKVTSIAVLPVEGDSEMGARLATLLQQETTLRVEVPATVVGDNSPTEPRSSEADEADRSTLAKKVTRDLGVDTVLVSRVVAGSPLHPSDWGRNAEGSRRLYLYLMNRDGHLLWKDELPFMLAKGDTSPQDASIMQSDLSDHVMQHVTELRLDELGYLPKKTLYRIPKKAVTLTR